MSSSESVGMAYDSTTNQIYLTDASKHEILQVSYRDNRHLIRVVAGDPSPGYVNGIGTLAQFNTPSDLAISSLTPPSPPSAPGYGLNSTHWLVIVGIIAFVKLSSQHLRFDHLLGLVVKVDNTDLLMEWNWY
jgi:hypothetical protein